MNERTGVPQPVYRRFESRREYEQLVDELIPQAHSAIRIFDCVLSSHYNSARRCDRLAAFLGKSRTRRVLIAVHEADHLERDCPRLIRLALQHVHAVRIHRTTKAARGASDACVIIDALHCLRRFHHDHMRAAISMHDANAAQTMLDRFDEIWEASAPARIGTGAGF
jgi:hypothetical protein